MVPQIFQLKIFSLEPKLFTAFEFFPEIARREKRRNKRWKREDISPSSRGQGQELDFGFLHSYTWLLHPFFQRSEFYLSKEELPT